MIVKRARGRGRQCCWYDRTRKTRSRLYHVIGLSRLVMKDGSCWRLILGPWTFAFGFRAIKSGRHE
jgi:hypothetical protein